MKSTVDYHFERKRQLQNYKGDQTRLKSILDKDHGDFIIDSMTSSMVEKKQELMTKEEFLNSIENGG